VLDKARRDGHIGGRISEVSSTTRCLSVDVGKGNAHDLQAHGDSSGYESDDSEFFQIDGKNGKAGGIENAHQPYPVRVEESGANTSANVHPSVEGKYKSILQSSKVTGSARSPQNVSLPAESLGVGGGHSLHNLMQDRYAQTLSDMAARRGAPPISCWGETQAIATNLDAITALQWEADAALTDTSGMAWLPKPVMLNNGQSTQSAEHLDVPKPGFWRSMLKTISRWMPGSKVVEVHNISLPTTASVGTAIAPKESLDLQIRRDLQTTVGRRWKTGGYIGGTMVPAVHSGTRSRTSATLRDVMAQDVQRQPRVKTGVAPAPPIVPKDWRPATRQATVGESFPVEGNDQQLKTRF